MEITELRNRIVGNDLPRLIVLNGPEIALKDIYLKQVIKKIDLPVSEIQFFSELKPKLSQRSLINKSQIYIVRQDEEIVSNEKYQDLLENVTRDYVILTYTKLNKGSKFYKRFKDNIYDFEFLDETTLTRYIQKDYSLSEYNCKELIKMCSSDYSRILLELDKVQNYCLAKGLSPIKINDVFTEMKLNRLIYEDPQDAIFDMIEAILRNKQKETYRLYEHSKAIGESNINILYNLYNNAKYVLQVQTANTKDLEKTTGLNKYQVKYAKEKMGYFAPEKLLYLMRLIFEVDRNIKIGEIDEEISVNYVLAKFFSMK